MLTMASSDDAIIAASHCWSNPEHNPSSSGNGCPSGTWLEKGVAEFLFMKGRLGGRDTPHRVVVDCPRSKDGFGV
jgi:hypothetical protein